MKSGLIKIFDNIVRYIALNASTLEILNKESNIPWDILYCLKENISAISNTLKSK